MEETKTRKRKPKFLKRGKAKRTMTAYLCGKDFGFKSGSIYEINDPEIWEKLTNKRNLILEEV